MLGLPLIPSSDAWFTRFMLCPASRPSQAGTPCPGVSSGLWPRACAFSPPSFSPCVSSPSFSSPPGKPQFCLGEGSCPSSAGVPFTTMTITGLLLHRPPAHQTGCLSQCPDLSTVARPFSRTPCQHLPFSGQSLILPVSLPLTTPRAVCLRHLLYCFCLQRQVLGKGEPGYWALGDRRGRERGKWGVRAHRRALSWARQAQWVRSCW